MFVPVFHSKTGGLADVPEELVEHWSELGWARVPETVNLADPEQVAGLFKPVAKPQKES